MEPHLRDLGPTLVPLVYNDGQVETISKKRINMVELNLMK